MALIDMVSEITDLVPKLGRVRARRLINRAWKIVQDSCLWSFQLQQGSFSTPSITTEGTVSCTLGSAQVTGDVNASAAWLALPFYWRATTQQWRAQGYSVYSVIAMAGNGIIAFGTTSSEGSGQTPGTYTVSILDGASPGGSGGQAEITVGSNGEVTAPPVILNGGSGYITPYILFSEGGTPATFTFSQFQVLTLDRNFTDPLPFYTGVAYQMYGAYIPMPVGFKRLLSMSDMFDVWTMDIWTSRRTLDYYDPARLVSSNPTVCAPLGADRRGAGTSTPSATINQQLLEMYPYPTYPIAYQWYAVIEWPYLINNTDTLPPPIDEEVVTQKALTWAYRDTEARKDIMAAKESGGNYLDLKKYSEEDFLARLKTLRLLDRDAVDSYLSDMKKATRNWQQAYFNSQTMSSGPWGG